MRLRPIPRCVLFAGALLAAGAPLAAAEAARYESEALAPGVTIYRRADVEGRALNSVVIERADGLLVVGPQDTPAAAAALLETIAKRTDRPVRYLVITGPHAVAAGGATAFPSGTLRIGSRGCLELMKRSEFDFAAEAGARHAENDAWTPPPRALPVLAPDATTLLDDPTTPVQLEPMPRGHTAGDLVVKLPSASIQIVGELVDAERNPWASGSSLSGWIGVLNNLAYEQPKAVVPLRGPVVDLYALRRQRSAFLWAKGQVAQAFVDVVPTGKIVDRIVASPELAKHFDTAARPALYRTVIEAALEEALDERRRRGLPLD